ncbi:MAG: Eco57I restriction-modification methylase domain-containing protein [Planctomycetaceae bacterium]|jgi:methylase of polypeptide subunit release factors|nr:Eco57I restriction-modification methylase domain-containing protein [Planctomycetaceae bacterium]
MSIKTTKRKTQHQNVCNEFYEKIRNWFYWTTKNGNDLPKNSILSVAKPEYTLRLIVRLLLCFFLKDKGVMPKELFDKNFIKENLKENENCSYYNAILRNIFFHCLNTPQKKRKKYEHRKLFKNFGIVEEQFAKIPFLNGGLFYEYSDDDFSLNNEYFFSELTTQHIVELDGDYQVEGIIRILSQYQYKLSIDDLPDEEDTQTVDPEFIGNVFENLLACIDANSKENRRKTTGSFYTPKEIVDDMVDKALDSYLQNHNDLLKCKILDPACGSGAFLCGIMNEIIQRLDPNRTMTPTERYHKKLEILRKVIYGIDIQPMAVQISALRIFLLLMQEIIPTKDVNNNYGIEPLPNLKMKFVCANTLIGLKKENQKQLELPVIKTIFNLLQETRNQYLMATTLKEKERFQKDEQFYRNSLSTAMKNAGILSQKTAKLTLQWNPYDQSKTSPFFDPIWMFGVKKFDIVIGNPPYDVLSAMHPLLNYYRNNFRCATGGKVNLYKLFFEKGFSLLKNNGTLVFITPYNYLTSRDSKKLREILISETTISEITDYEESQQIFDSSTQAVAVIVAKNKVANDYSFRYHKLGVDYELQSEVIKQDRIWQIKGTNSIIAKMNHCRQTFNSIADGWQGEINISTKKHFFIEQQKKGHLPLIRGNQIGYYQTVLSPLEFCPIEISTRTHHNDKRIVFQEIANAGLARRIKGTILENVLCGHTTNYLIANNNISLEAILGLLNSKIVNYYFKFYNQTNHVPIGEIKAIPIPDNFATANKKLTQLVSRRLQGEDVDGKIDTLIYELYGLTDEEQDFIKNYEIKFRADK